MDCWSNKKQVIQWYTGGWFRRCIKDSSNFRGNAWFFAHSMYQQVEYILRGFLSIGVRYNFGMSLFELLLDDCVHFLKLTPVAVWVFKSEKPTHCLRAGFTQGPCIRLPWERHDKSLVFHTVMVGFKMVNDRSLLRRQRIFLLDFSFPKLL